MKIVTITLVLGVLLSWPPFSPIDLDDGLVARYSFNQCDARDDSGNGSHGDLYGGVDCWCGIEDDGLLLDGSQGYIEFHGPVNRFFSTSDFTISFYFKAEQYTVFLQSLLSKSENCDNFHVLDLLLDVNQQEVDPRLHETPNRYFPGLTTALAGKGWMHFALVREGLKASTYINGQLQQESFRCSGIDISNDAVLSFSNSPCVLRGKARRFRGVIDELRIYDRALTPPEIRQLYRMFPIENAQMDCFS